MQGSNEVVLMYLVLSDPAGHVDTSPEYTTRGLVEGRPQ